MTKIPARTGSRQEARVRRPDGAPRRQLAIVCAVRDNLAGIRRLLAAFTSVAGRLEGLELVVVDGASADGTAALLAAAAEALGDRLAFVSEPDAGLYEALDKAAALVSARFVLVIGSDDDLLVDPLGPVLERLAGFADDAAVILDFEQEVGGGPSPYRYRVSQQALAASAAQLPPVHHQGFLMPRADFARGFDRRYRLHADYKAMAACLARTPPHYLPLALCRFRLGGSSTRPAGAWRSIREQWQIRRELGVGQPLAGYALLLVKAIVILSGLEAPAARFRNRWLGAGGGAAPAGRELPRSQP